jgi:uracil-DNA glycosylase family 4
MFLTRLGSFLRSTSHSKPSPRGKETAALARGQKDSAALARVYSEPDALARVYSEPDALARVQAEIIACERCPRLRSFCGTVAREKRRAFRDEIYWGRPVPGFGDPRARLLLIGLAPAAHGANRTGRVFTGDGAGGSGDFLMGALHRAGFANIATSQRPDDGLTLRDAFIAAAVRCAPPDNRPTLEEITNCLAHLDAEVTALSRVRVVVALGRISFDAYLQLLKRRGLVLRPRPQFAHGAVYTLTNGQTLVGSYHPSRQNTNTGKLTAVMMDGVLAGVRTLLSGP